jgi:hypothetical protein
MDVNILGGFNFAGLLLDDFRSPHRGITPHLFTLLIRHLIQNGYCKKFVRCMCNKSIVVYDYCIEDIEMRQLAFRSADIYCQNINNLKCTLALFLYTNGKKGKQADSERDRERECASVGALQKDGCWRPS